MVLVLHTNICPPRPLPRFTSQLLAPCLRFLAPTQACATPPPHPCFPGLSCRYDIGATSGALVSMTSQQYSGTDWYSLSAFQSGLVVSLSLAGALLGSGGPAAWRHTCFSAALCCFLRCTAVVLPALRILTGCFAIIAGAALLYGDKLGRRRELLAASALYGEWSSV